MESMPYVTNIDPQNLKRTNSGSVLRTLYIKYDHQRFNESTTIFALHGKNLIWKFFVFVIRLFNLWSNFNLYPTFGHHSFAIYLLLIAFTSVSSPI